MSSEQLAVTPPFVKASTQLSSYLGIEPGMMIETIKAQCFKGKRPEEVSDAQLAAFVSVCNVVQLNPLIPGMLYAYPEKNGGITPIVGPDGTMKKIDEFISSGKLEGYECEVFPTDGNVPPTHATAIIYRKGDLKPAKYTAWFKEWVVGHNPNWTSRPRHMLWIRALKQAARQVIHGLPMDDDEYKIAQMTNVTETGDAAPEPVTDRPKVERKKRGAATVVEAEAPATEGKPADDKRQSEIAKASATAVEAQVVEEKNADAAPAQSITALKDKETLTLENVIVDSFVAKNFGTDAKPNYAVKATLKGPFIGDVYDLNAKFADGKITHSDAWQIERPIKVTLVGKLRTNGTVGVTATEVSVMEAAQQEVP